MPVAHTDGLARYRLGPTPSAQPGAEYSATWEMPDGIEAVMRYAVPIAEVARGDIEFLQNHSDDRPSNDVVVMRAVAGTIAYDRLMRVLRSLGHVSLSVRTAENQNSPKLWRKTSTGCPATWSRRRGSSTCSRIPSTSRWRWCCDGAWRDRRRWGRPASAGTTVNPPRLEVRAWLSPELENSGIKHIVYSNCYPLALAKGLERVPSYTVHQA